MRVGATRLFVVAVLLGTAAVVQSSLLPALGLSSRTGVLVFIVVLGLSQRVEFHEAVLVGCIAGLLVDLTPPGLGPLGVNALLGTLCAAAMHAWSRANSTDTASLGSTFAVLLTAVALVGISRLALSGLLGQPLPFAAAATSVIRDLVFALLAVPALLPFVSAVTANRGGSGNLTSRRRV